MPTTLKFGFAQYHVYTQVELEDMGMICNPHMWIGDGWIFCPNCNNYHYSVPMSHRGQSDCYHLCLHCKCHTRRNPIVDIYAEYSKKFPLTNDPRD